jgi:hypothetical protein
MAFSVLGVSPLLIVLCAELVTAKGFGAGKKPHIISILQDDLGYYDSGMHNPAAVCNSLV